MHNEAATEELRLTGVQASAQRQARAGPGARRPVQQAFSTAWHGRATLSCTTGCWRRAPGRTAAACLLLAGSHTIIYMYMLMLHIAWTATFDSMLDRRLTSNHPYYSIPPPRPTDLYTSKSLTGPPATEGEGWHCAWQYRSVARPRA